MSSFLQLAEELERARSEHLDSFGSAPKVVRKARRKILQILWDDKTTIIDALRRAHNDHQ